MRINSRYAGARSAPRWPWGPEGPPGSPHGSQGPGSKALRAGGLGKHGPTYKSGVPCSARSIYEATRPDESSYHKYKVLKVPPQNGRPRTGAESGHGGPLSMYPFATLVLSDIPFGNSLSIYPSEKGPYRCTLRTKKMTILILNGFCSVFCP